MNLNKNKKTIFFSFLAFLFFSCGYFSKNTLSQSSQKIFLEKEQLTLKRASWFRELTLLFDVYYMEISPAALPLFFKDLELSALSSCKSLYFTLSYVLDTGPSLDKEFEKQWKKQNFSSFSAETFLSTFKTHPLFESLSLQLYRPKVYCHPQAQIPPISIKFSNFKEISL